MAGWRIVGTSVLSIHRISLPKYQAQTGAIRRQNNLDFARGVPVWAGMLRTDRFSGRVLPARGRVTRSRCAKGMLAHLRSTRIHTGREGRHTKTWKTTSQWANWFVAAPDRPIIPQAEILFRPKTRLAILDSFCRFG